MITKASNYNTKSNSDQISCIILFDFAENYQCIIQNASLIIGISLEQLYKRKTQTCEKIS